MKIVNEMGQGRVNKSWKYISNNLKKNQTFFTNIHYKYDYQLISIYMKITEIENI